MKNLTLKVLLDKKNCAIILGMLFFIQSCIPEIKEPVLPTWETSYDLALIDRTQTIKDAIKDAEKSFIFIDSTTQDLLIKVDSTKTEIDSIQNIFKDNIKYDDHFVVKVNRVDTLTFEAYVSDDSTSFEEAKVFKGLLEYNLNNHLDRKISVNVTIPGFTKLNGSKTDTLKFEVSANPKTSGKQTIKLDGFNYKQLPSNPFGNPKPGIYLKGFARIDGGYSGDSISIDVKLTDLAISYFKGKIKPLTRKIKEKTSEIDIDSELRDILPKVEIYEAKVLFRTSAELNGVEIGLRNFQVLGLFKDGSSTKVLKINNRTTLDTVISLSNQPIVISVGSFAIREFLSPKVPDSIFYKGDIVINPNYKTIEINLPTVISYSYQFNLYSIFRIDNVDKTDTAEIWSDKDWNSKDKKDFDKRIENASEMELTMEIDNGLPIGFSLVGFLADTSYKKLFAITRQEGTGSSADTVLTVLPANIDLDGKVSSSVFQTKKLKLTKDEILKIKNAKYLILKAIAFTSSGRKVYLRANDFIRLKAFGSFKVKFDSESFKD